MLQKIRPTLSLFMAAVVLCTLALGGAPLSFAGGVHTIAVGETLALTFAYPGAVTQAWSGLDQNVARIVGGEQGEVCTIVGVNPGQTTLRTQVTYSVTVNGYDGKPVTTTRFARDSFTITVTANGGLAPSPTGVPDLTPSPIPTGQPDTTAVPDITPTPVPALTPTPAPTYDPHDAAMTVGEGGRAEDFDVIYDELSYEGLAPAVKNGKLGFINHAYKVVIPFVYDAAQTTPPGARGLLPNRFGFGIARVKPFRTQSEIVKPDAVVPDDIIIDKEGKPINFSYDPAYRIETLWTDGNHILLWLSHSEDHSTVYGIYNMHGVLQMPLTASLYDISAVYSHFSYDYILLFPTPMPPSDNWTAGSATAPPAETPDGTEQFSIVTPLEYDRVFGFSEGLGQVMKDGKTGFVDAKGQRVIPLVYDNLGETCFSQGLAAVQQGDRFGYIDNTGHVVIPFVYEDAYAFQEGLALVKKDGGYGYITKTGESVGGFVFDKGYDFSEGYARVVQNGLYGYLDATGALAVPCVYTHGGDVREGIAPVGKDGQYGYIALPPEGHTPGETTPDPTRPDPDPTPTTQPSAALALASGADIFVNGFQMLLGAYTIEGYNYFKLRDFAYVIGGTPKAFDVSWDNERQAINLLSGTAYTIVGGEMSEEDIKSRIATANTSVIYRDGQEVSLTAYTIGGYNYLKLRDLARLFDIGVTYDEETDSVGIDTSLSYVE